MGRAKRGCRAHGHGGGAHRLAATATATAPARATAGRMGRADGAASAAVHVASVSAHVVDAHCVGAAWAMDTSPVRRPHHQRGRGLGGSVAASGVGS
jgi:hypothetical protein